MAEDLWFFVDGQGAQQGPVGLGELRAALRTLSPQAMVWRSGLAEWMPASALPELGPPASPLPPPVPPDDMASQPAATRGPAVAGEEPSLNPWSVFKRSFQPNGRFSRGELAVAYFTPLIALLIFYAVAVAITVATESTGREGAKTAGAFLVILSFIPVVLLLLASVVTQVVASVRRCHDLGQSGTLALLTFIPCVNLVFLFYLLLTPGVPSGSTASTAGKSSKVVIAVIAGVALIPLVGIVAAIAIPSLLRARVSANESAAIGDIRTLISAQAAYQSANNGYYDTLACLTAPTGCLPGFPAGGPTFLAPTLAAEVKSGYRRTFHAGPSAVDTSGASPSSITAYAYVAEPAEPGRTGVRIFCGDSTGRVCAAAAGTVVTPAAGLCPEICTTLN